MRFDEFKDRYHMVNLMHSLDTLTVDKLVLYYRGSEREKQKFEAIAAQSQMLSLFCLHQLHYLSNIPLSKSSVP